MTSKKGIFFVTDRNKKIIELYINNPELTVKQIAQQFKISTSTISRIIRINNLPRRTGSNKKILSEQQIKDIKNKYTNGIPLITIQKEYNINYDRVKDIVKCCDIVSCSKRLNPNLIENYFQCIDTCDKAYWLGLLISDGSITYQPKKSKFQLELTLKQEDEDILNLLQNDLGVQNKIYPSNFKYRRFSLGSKKIVTDLVNLGVTQNKTFTVKVPVFNKEYNSSFIRGLFDGDGGFTVYIRSSGQKCMELSFCGNNFIIEWVLNTLINEIPKLTKNSITKEGSIKRIRWSSKKDIILIRNYLYNNSNIHYLYRKYNLIYANTEVTN